MVEQNSAQLDLVFQALSDQTRRAILRTLSVGERTVTELAEPFSISLAAVSKHIKVLERAGLVRQTVQGRQRICRIEAGALWEANAWLRYYEEFWTDRFEAFGSMFEQQAKE